MAILNQAGKVLFAQIVFAGPGLSGKTTNLRWLSARLPRTRFTEFPTEHERTAFFDELPITIPLASPGWRLSVKLQTVPGQTHATAARARRVVMRRPDLVVFVADSDERRAAANRRALDEVQDILTAGGGGPCEVPLIFQYNKQDVAGALEPSVMETLLNHGGATYVLAEAVRGIGVIDTLKVAVERVRAGVASEYGQVLADP